MYDAIKLKVVFKIKNVYCFIFSERMLHIRWGRRKLRILAIEAVHGNGWVWARHTAKAILCSVCRSTNWYVKSIIKIVLYDQKYIVSNMENKCGKNCPSQVSHFI